MTYDAIAAFARRAIRERNLPTLTRVLIECAVELTGALAGEVYVVHAVDAEPRLVHGSGPASTATARAIVREAAAAPHGIARTLDGDAYFTYAAAAAARCSTELWIGVLYATRTLGAEEAAALETLMAIFAASVAHGTMEERLQQDEALLRLAFEQIPAVLWTADRNLVVTSAQGAAKLDLPKIERVGKRLTELALDEDSLPVRASLAALEGKSTTYEYTYYDRRFENRIEPLRDASGAIAGVIGIAFDVTARSRAEEELRASREELRSLGVHMQRVQENERRRIAHELHDDLGQRLTAIHFELENAAAALGERAAILETVRALAKSSIGEVRRVAMALRPGILDELGLRAAVEQELSAFRTRTGIECRLRFEWDEALDDDLATAIYRIVQEALTNIARHAGATRVSVTLDVRDERVCLSVQDDGRGIEPGDLLRATSIGLLGLRERASAFGGEVEITGTPGEGTTVLVRLPLPAEVAV
ncbi:MAG TPA: ATP-binding protein [Thermoanaerobaculia bacterium]